MIDSTISILIADDHEKIARCLQMALESQSGIGSIKIACNPDECEKAAREFLPQVILVETKRQRKNGLELARVLRNACPDAAMYSIP